MGDGRGAETMKAIETEYNGYKFRSRLEARWAVFFDALGIEYQYEPEGFDLDGIWYLPDFWLPQVRMWAEVKPEQFTDSQRGLCEKLVRGTGFHCLMLDGPPDTRGYLGLGCYISLDTGKPEIIETDYAISTYHNYYIDEHRFYGGGISPEEFERDGLFDDVWPAVVAARQARFEHGQSGAK